MARLVVLGASGFLGKALVMKLATERPEDIVVACTRMDSLKSIDGLFRDMNNVEILTGDFYDSNDLSGWLPDADYVFHMVSSTNPAASHNNPLIDIETNVKGSIQLFELCVQHGVKKIIFPSSGGTVYGETSRTKVDETEPTQPTSPYGIGKVSVENYLRYFKKVHGIDYVIYRISNPYGPGQSSSGSQGVIPIFMEKYRNGEPLRVYGDGSMIRDYIYIDDLVQMIAKSFSKNNAFSEYNLGSGVGADVNDIITLLNKLSGQKASEQHVEAPEGFVQKSTLDISRFNSEFGAVPLTRIEDGIRKFWEYASNEQ